MIRGIRLTRFRGFEDAKMELRPLTLVMGPNSSGKSTFGQALVALQQVHRRRSMLVRLDEDYENEETWPVDLGGYADVLTRGCQGDVAIAVDVDIGGSIGSLEYGFGGLGNGLELSRIKLVEARLLDQPVAGGTAVTVATIVDRTVLAPSDEFARVDRSTWKVHGQLGTVQLDGLRIVRVMHDSGTAFPITSRAQEALLLQLEHLRYLQPNRINPSREGYAAPKRSKAPLGTGSDGRWTAFTLLDQGATILKGHRTPVPLPTHPTDALRALGAEWPETSFSLRDGVNFWMHYLGLATRIDATTQGDRVDVRASLESDDEPYSLEDVGFGISQVLPVLVEGLTLPAGGLFVVEQPESQLHPRAQARLGDFFCALAKRGDCALVECHSEPMFRRIQTRVLLDPKLADLVQVVFIDEAEQSRCQQPRVVDLKSDLVWPRGFLADAVEEELALLAASSARAAP